MTADPRKEPLALRSLEPEPPTTPPKPGSEQLISVLEALLFVNGRPIAASTLAKAIPGVGEKGVEKGLASLGERFEAEARGLRLRRLAGGYTLEAASVYAPYVARLGSIRRRERLSPGALQTLAVIAYKQPITRAEIESLRGVDASSALKSLLEKRLIRTAGRAKKPGRPMLYATSRKKFLEWAGLNSLDELPSAPNEPLPAPTSLLAKPVEPAPPEEDGGGGTHL